MAADAGDRAPTVANREAANAAITAERLLQDVAPCDGRTAADETGPTMVVCAVTADKPPARLNSEPNVLAK
ncbi:hypothetical protein Pth03_04740 [Planotetraspora thailandica]|uniref:Uncharacterized protein n=1 Tax=Planotetraspora thailandica TaxID=487172 RepID=A0A8J3XTF2_9ACTN|nr:hypothetical protein Pth03_04740 [Planotetraspora thailandica]